jgi:hypothetical protein
MTTKVTEVRCIHNEASEETVAACSWCQSIINYQPKKGWNVHLTPLEHEQAIVAFGGPGHSTKRRWATLLSAMQDSEHIKWARLESLQDPIAELPCSEAEFRELSEGIQKGRSLRLEEERWLQNGIRFFDGTVLRYLHQIWHLDDVQLGSLSLQVLFPLLANTHVRTGWNLPSLILGLSSTSPLKKEVFTGESGFHDGMFGHRVLRSNYRPLASMLVWLTRRLHVDRTSAEPHQERVPMMAWAHDIQTRMFRRQPRAMESIFANALTHHPPGLFELYDTPWMRSWQTLQDTNRHPTTLNWSMRTSNRHLNFRVRTRRGNTRLVKVPPEPGLWALLISLSLSPLHSDAGRFLLGLQHNWSVAYTQTAPPSTALLKSLEFCHQIMNGQPERIHLEHARVLVFGSMGHVYEVRVGSGQHGAPYQISHKTGFEQHQQRAICIHSGRPSTALPLGDTMGGVLLSMLNDVKASETVHSLEEMIINEPPFGFSSRDVPTEWLDSLDQDALRHLRRNGRSMDPHSWFNSSAAEPTHSRPQGQDRQGAALFHLQRRYRRRRRNSLENNTWHHRYRNHFDEHGTFPYDEVANEWRQTVSAYVPANTEPMGGVFGRRAERMLRRYHHLMPHRRHDDLHEEGDIRDGERRWCEIFAGVWELLLLQPIGSFVRIPTRNNGQLSFEHGGLRLTLRTAVERNFVISISRLLGYEMTGEGGGERFFVRRDHPRPDARLRLADLLNEAQERQGIRGAPPRWWNYIDVMAAPDGVPHLGWELHVDRTDRPNPRQEDENIPFRGLGDLFG